MKAYDTITLDINSEQFTVKLDPDDVGESFSALIDRTMFEWVGSLDNCPFKYRVRDQLGNFTDGHRWSGVIYANIDLVRNFFPIPLLREDTSDNSDDPKVVDLEDIDKSLLVVVRANDLLYQIGDLVTAFYRLDDSAEKATAPAAFPADDFGDLATCVVHIAKDQLVPEKTLQVRFQVERPKGTVIGTSGIATAEIIGESAPDLQAPKIKQAQGNSMFPFAAKDGLTALVSDPSIQLKDVIVVTWTGAAGVPAGGSYTSPPYVVEVLGTQEIAIDKSVVAFNLGREASVRYSKTTGSVTRGSLPLALSVQNIPDGHSELPTPTIDRVSGDELDPADLLQSDHTRTTAWPLIALGQRVWLTYTEIKTDGSTGFVEEAYKGREVTTEDLGGIKHPIPLAGLQEMKEGSTLEVEVKVSFSGELDEVNTTAFPKLVCRVHTEYEDLTTFTDFNTNGWQIYNSWGSIIKESDEYYARSIYIEGFHKLFLRKSYPNLKGQAFELSLDYRCAGGKSTFWLTFYNEKTSSSVVNLRFPVVATWVNITMRFFLEIPMSDLPHEIEIASQSTYLVEMDNIRLKKISCKATQ